MVMNEWMSPLEPSKGVCPALCVLYYMYQNKDTRGPQEGTPLGPSKLPRSQLHIRYAVCVLWCVVLCYAVLCYIKSYRMVSCGVVFCCGLG